MFSTIIQHESRYYLVCDRTGGISVKDTSKEVIDELEGMYSSSHSNGREASASAAIHYMQFQPQVVEIPSTIPEVVVMLDSMSLFTLRCVAGVYTGMRLKPEVATELLKKAVRVKLIS